MLNTQNAFYFALAAVFANLNTFNDLLLQQVIYTFCAAARGEFVNTDALLDEFNAAYEEDMATVGAERAGVVLARTHIEEAISCLEHYDEAAALNLLAQAIVQRQYALEQLFA